MHTQKCLGVVAWIVIVFLMFAAPVAAAPDLVVTSVLGPKVGNVGAYIAVYASVKNQGTTAAGAFRLNFYLSTDPTITTGDSYFAYCDYTNLGAGETDSTCGGPIGVPNWFSPGTYYLGAYVDVNGQITESSESNNTGVAPDRIILGATGVDVVATPDTPSGPGSGTAGVTYQFSTGGSGTSLNHQVQYLLDFGDGTNSGWLPLGQTWANKSWAADGNYQVKAQARCATEPSAASAWSSSKTVVIGTPPPSGPWTSVNLPYVAPNWSLAGLSFTSTGEGWAVGWGWLTAPRGDILFHYSGGAWTSVIPPAVSADYVLLGVDFISPDNGWAVGADQANSTGATIHYSGGNWTPVATPNLGPGIQWQLNGVSFLSSGEGWAVGSVLGGSSGIILHYSGGAWANTAHPSNPGLNGVYFTSPSEGWAVGGGKTLLHYSGGTWDSVTPPNVSSNWGLSGVYFTSPDEGWAVGTDNQNKRGVLLHRSGGAWSSVTPPNVSADYGLSAAHFLSPDEGWAVGGDSTNHVGVLLHYSAGKWTSVTPPTLGVNWALSNVQLTSAGEGWAVGGNGQQGLLLHYSVATHAVIFDTNPSGLKISVNGIEHTTPKTFYWPAGEVHTVSAPSPQTFQSNQYAFTSWSDGGGQTHDITVPSQNATYTALFQQQAEAVSTPTFLTGPTSGNTGTSYTYSTGGSNSTLGHDVEYQFDWKGDGSDTSSWGSATQSKTWANSGAYSVRARARCMAHHSVVSNWSQGLPVTITQTPPVSAPDLTGEWTSLTVSSKNTYKGTQWKMKGIFKAKNIGDKDAPSTAYVSFYLSENNTYSPDDLLLKKLSAGKLKKGKNKSLTLTVILPYGVTVNGKYVIAIVDPQAAISESNENNNQIVYGPIP